MTPTSPTSAPGLSRWLALAIIVLSGVIGIAAWQVYAPAFIAEPVQDWLAYETAVQSYFSGDLGLLSDGARFTAQLNATFAGWLSQPLSLHPWVYPPHFLLLLLPFGVLPAAAGCVLFQAASFAGLLAAGWRFAATASRRAGFAAVLVLCPATAFNVGVGQNGFLSGALLLGGFGLLARSPLVAGALLGVLTYKPQLWLMVPVALIAARQWRALGSAVAVAVTLAVLSGAVFGFEIWRQWLSFAAGDRALYGAWVEAGRLKGMSVYASASVLGATPAFANILQAAATAAAAGIVYWTQRQSAMSEGLRIAVILAATILAAPHVSNYDCVLLAVAAALVLIHALDHGFRLGELIAGISVWAWPLFNPPSVFRAGLATPLLIVLFMAAVIARARADAAMSSQASSLTCTSSPITRTG